ncbi:MAG TPA: GAF domain-containing protein [Kangiella sp.]
METSDIYSVLKDFSSGLQSAPSPSQVMWLICNTVEKTGLNDCVVYNADIESEELTQVAAIGAKVNELQQIIDPIVLKFGQSIVGNAALLKREIIVDNTALTPNYVVDGDICASELSVPIIYDNTILGVIDSEHKEPNFYKQHHLLLFKTLAALAAPWIGNPKIPDQYLTRRKTDRQQASIKYGLHFDNSQLKQVTIDYMQESFRLFASLSHDEFEEIMKVFLKHYSKPYPFKHISVLDKMLAKHNEDFKRFLCDRVKDLVKLSMDDIFLPSPKTQRYHFIIEHTYINPLNDHQAVADELGMSYSTFARHLAKARAELIDFLWAKLHKDMKTVAPIIE